MEESTNKRIAKNAFMLTIRMVLTTIVGLYTSRVVLATLGVTDFGIYGVVGGVVSMLSFLNTSMASATSRFLTYEMGKGNSERLAKIFSTSLLAHMMIAAIVLICAETIGLWFLNERMNIPVERMAAANWVYQMSIISTILSITQSPYNAIIISHEKMDVYAYLEIINVTLKLLIVYLITIGVFDKLIFYSVLSLSVSVIMILMYRIYCIKNYQESRFHWIWDKSILMPIVSFSGFDIYGNMCVVFSNQGRSILINIFFGVLYNAAVSIAQTVNSAILGLTSSIMTAFKPQIVKLYAQGKIAEMQVVMTNALKFNLIAYAMLAIPCCIEAHYVLYLWLGQVPLHSVMFLRLMMLVSLLLANVTVNNSAIHATGNIKYVSFLGGSIYLLSIIVSWIAFKCGASAWMSYAIYAFAVVIIIGSGIYIIKRQIPQFKPYKFLGNNIRLYIVIFGVTVPLYFCSNLLSESFWRVMITVINTIVTLGLVSWFILFTSSNREEVKKKISKFIKKKSH